MFPKRCSGCRYLVDFQGNENYDCTFLYGKLKKWHDRDGVESVDLAFSRCKGNDFRSKSPWWFVYQKLQNIPWRVHMCLNSLDKKIQTVLNFIR